MIEILELEVIGYRFTVDGDHIAYRYEGKNPEREIVLPLLNAIHQKRGEAIEYLMYRRAPIDIASHLLDQANKAEEASDFERWIRLLEAASLERSKSYAMNQYDRQRCPKCPYLGKGSLYEMANRLVLCDVPCPDSG